MNQRYQFHNWARTYSCNPSSYLQPTSEAELIKIVEQAYANGLSVRLVGAGHSWSPVALTDGIMINLDNYAGLIDLDVNSMTVEVQAGMRLKQLNAILHQAGLALANLGSISEQSVAGAISTGTHGTGRGLQILASQVVALRLIDGRGKQHQLTANHVLFPYALVSLGCLGIISTVKLKVVPAFALKEVAYPLLFDEALKQIPLLLQANRHVKFWWFPHAPKLQVYTQNISAVSPVAENRVLRYFNEVIMDQYVFAGLLGTGQRIPGIIPRLNRLINALKFKKEERIGRSDRIMNVSMPPRHREAEYAIPIEHTAAALTDIREMIERDGFRINFVLEVRFVKGDAIPLSPAFGRDVCYLGAYKAGNHDWFRYLAAFEKIILKYNGRPHWGKETVMDGKAVRALYPMMESFLQVRSDMDPKDIFLNDFTRKMLID